MLHRRLLTNDKLLYRVTVDGHMGFVDQRARVPSDFLVSLDGFCCVLFATPAVYLALPSGFMYTHFACSSNNCFGLPDVNSDEQYVNLDC